MTPPHDPLSAAIELREQLGSETRRLLFFFGAGTSMSVGLPGIVDLTKQVLEQLPDPQKGQFEALFSELPKDSTVETLLDNIRTLRELIGESEVKTYDGLKRDTAKSLDLAICQAISAIVRKPAPKGLTPHQTYAQWIRTLYSRRDWPVEVFTTNYDLFFEVTMEDLGVPYFDGFIGSVEAFFAPESVDATGSKRDESVYPPKAWTRLWKLHGSVNWRVQDASKLTSGGIFRTASSACEPGQELAVFPSRDKYSQSRKLPFLALQDRFRRSLSSAECLLVIVGYSFSDQHLNEIIFQGLRSNPHLATAAFLFTDDEDILGYGSEHRNFAIYAPSKACVGGITAPWNEPRKRKDGEEWPFWNEANKQFRLGDFNQFTKFLEVFIGFRPQLPVNLKDSESSPSATAKTL
jgi:hypothetical protein